MQHKTIDSVLERGEKLDTLVEKSSDLSAASQVQCASKYFLLQPSSWRWVCVHTHILDGYTGTYASTDLNITNYMHIYWIGCILAYDFMYALKKSWNEGVLRCLMHYYMVFFSIQVIVRASLFHWNWIYRYLWPNGLQQRIIKWVRGEGYKMKM